MDNQLTATIASTVLSSSSGLRAYLPLFALGIAANVGVIPLQSGYDILKNPLLLGALGLLSLLEIIADKFPLVDHASDVIHTVIRPVMGAVIFSGTTNLVSAHGGMVGTIAAAVIGGVLAGGVHGAKALSRPVVTGTTFGFGNPAISIIEDIATITLVILAVAIPVVAVILLVFFVGLFVLIMRWAWRRLRRRKRQQAGVVDASRAGGTG